MHADWLARLSDVQINWLAGLLEGEGCFLRATPSDPGRPRVTVNMTDEDVIERVAAMWQVRHRVTSESRARSKGWKTSYTVKVSGRKAVELMTLIRPLMSQRRQSQIDAALATWTTQPRKITREQGAEVVIAMQAGTAAATLAERYGVSKWTIYSISEGRYFDRPGRVSDIPSELMPWPNLSRTGAEVT